MQMKKFFNYSFLAEIFTDACFKIIRIYWFLREAAVIQDWPWILALRPER